MVGGETVQGKLQVQLGHMVDGERTLCPDALIEQTRGRRKSQTFEIGMSIRPVKQCDAYLRGPG